MHVGRKPREDEGTDGSVASTSQETPKIACKAPEARVRHGLDPPSQRLEELTDPGNTLISDVWRPER